MGSHGGPKIVRDRLKLLLDGRDEGLRGGKSVLTDGSGNSNSGSMYTGACINLDGGSDYINSNATFQSTFRDSWSWECWIKPSDGQDPAGPDLMGMRNSNYQDWVHVEVYSDGSISMYYASDGDGKYARTSDVIFTDGVNDWHHIVAVADDATSQMYIYVNGVVQDLKSGTSWDGDMSGITMADFTTPDYIYIGARNKYTSGGAEEHFNGRMSNCKLFSTALSAANVLELYNNSNKVVPSGISSSQLAGWWPLSEGSGTTAYDGSGNNNNGTLVNGISYETSVGTIPQLAGKGLSTKAVFDGSNDYVGISSYVDWDVADKYTVSFWMYMTSTGLQTFFSMHASTYADQIEILTNNGVREIFINNVDAGGTYCQCDTNNTIWSTNEWTHVTITNNGGTGATSSLNSIYSIYINGVSQTVNNLEGSVATVGTNRDRKLMVGQHVPGGRYIGGIMDEVAIWNTNLDSDAVSAVYNSGKPVDVRDNYRLYDEYTDNLRGYWRNNGTIDWKDLSGYGHDLSSSGSPAVIKSPEGITFGRDSHGMNLSEPNAGIFNGSTDYLQVNTSDSIANVFDGGGTWSTWINPLSDGENDQGRIMDKSDGGQWRVQSQSGNNVEMFFFLPFSSTAGYWSTTAAVVPIDEWSYVVLTYDSGAVTNNPKFYVDGVEITAVTEDQTPVGTRTSGAADNMFFMANTAATSRALDGRIAQTSVYNKILSAAEILQNYNMHKSRFK